jgi:hypothetical protein
MYAHHEKNNSSPPYSSVSNPVPCGAMVAVTFPEGGSAVVLFTCPLDSSEVTFSDVPCGTTSDSTVPEFELLITLLADVFCSDVPCGIGSALMFLSVVLPLT